MCFFLAASIGAFTVEYKCWDEHLKTNRVRASPGPSVGILCDLLWSDPDKDVVGWGENDRGVSWTFGADVVDKFLEKHDLDLVCRAHQVCTCVCMFVIVQG